MQDADVKLLFQLLRVILKVLMFDVSRRALIPDELRREASAAAVEVHDRIFEGERQP